MSIGPPPVNSLKIFDVLPPSDSNTFEAGIIQKDATTKEMQSIILFSPNLQIIASLDNVNSAATSTYEVDITQGFTFSSTQSISITDSIGANFEIVSEKVSLTLALSFTEEWNKSTTKKMKFSCPPGKEAFVYQGTLMARVLNFYAKNGGYEWQGDAAKALTQAILTSERPVGKAPSNLVTINHQ